MIKISAPWVFNDFPRIDSGLDRVNSVLESTVASSEYFAPFSLYIDSIDEDEELCYVGVRPALLNDIAPIIALPDNTDEIDVAINAEEAPLIAVELEGTYNIYLNIELSRESVYDDFVIERAVISKENGSLVENTDTLITHSIILGYVTDSVATSYHSTSLNAEVCEEAVTVWAV